MLSIVEAVEGDARRPQCVLRGAGHARAARHARSTSSLPMLARPSRTGWRRRAVAGLETDPVARPAEANGWLLLPRRLAM